LVGAWKQMHAGLGEIFTQGKRDGWTLKKNPSLGLFIATELHLIYIDFGFQPEHFGSWN
jgi:hypothetical protein